MPGGTREVAVRARVRTFGVAAALACFAAAVSSGAVVAQETGSIAGRVTSASGSPVAGAQLYIQELSRGTITNEDGRYLLLNIPAGTHTVAVTLLGYRTESATVTVDAGARATQDFALAQDALKLETLVVTGTQSPVERLEAPVAISVVGPEDLERAMPRSTTEMLRYVPGFTRVESSGGNVNQNITMRGVLGVEYVMFMEDGLPVYPTMHTFFMNADNLFRPDLNIERIEVVRGGTSALFGSSTPGAIINFINETGSPEVTGAMKLSAATEGLMRWDFNVSGPIVTDDWRFNLGGFYRYDHGVRDPGFPGIRGGQLKANITRLLDNGHLRVSFKHIDDRNQFILPLPFTNPDDPAYVGGFSEYGAFTTQEGNHITVPTPTGRLELPLDDGIRTKGTWLTANAGFDFGDGWHLENSAQLMEADHQWNAIVPSDVMPADAWAAGFIANYGAALRGSLIDGGTLPAGADSITVELLPGYEHRFLFTNHYDDTGAKLAFNTGNGFVAPGGEWHIEKPITAFQNQLRVRKAFGEHDVSAGFYFANYTQRNRWYFTEILTDVRDNPRFLDVMLDDATFRYHIYEGDAETGTVDHTVQDAALTKNGFRRFVSLFTNGWGQTTVYSGMFGGAFQFTPRLKADVGLRIERNDFVQTAENASTEDLDGDPTTAYDAEAWGDGTYRHFRKAMTSWAGSLGLNYTINPRLAVYALGSRAFKMPALDEFLNATAQDQVDLFDARETRTVEGGVKYLADNFGLTVNGFLVQLTNIVGQGAVIDDETGEITWVVTTSPENRSYGVEFELSANPRDGLTVLGTGTILKAELGTGAGADIGSWLNGVPPFIGNLAVNYAMPSGLGLVADWHYVGRRYANFAEGVELGAYNYTNFGATYRLPWPGMSLKANVLNAFQSQGFEEGNPRLVAGSSSNVFLARPVLPRRFRMSLRYAF